MQSPTRRVRGALSFVCSLMLAAPAAAQQQTPLTLQDAITLAAKQGPAASAARSALDEARARDRAFSARLLPQIELQGDVANYNHAVVPVLLSTGETVFAPQSQNESNMGLSVTQALPWLGGTLKVTSLLDRLDQTTNTGNGANPSRTWKSTPFQIEIDQNLFQPREQLWDTRAQVLRSSVAEQQYLEAREDIAASTASAFFDYYAATVALQNATANAAVNDTLYTLNKGRYEVGKIGENDLLASELALLNARAAVDGARLERDRSESALRRLINVHGTDTLAIAAPNQVPTIEADPDVAVREALRNSSLIQQAELDSVSAKRSETEARFRNGLTASLGAGYGMNQTSPLFGTAYASPLPKQSFRLGITIPFFQWGAGHADLQAARAEQARVASTSRQRREQLMEDARYAALQLTQSLRQLAISAKADTVATKRFEVAKNRYVIGKIGISDLFIAQNEKNQALNSYIQALRGVWTGYYHLRRVTLYDFVRKSELR
jgi:outer membrane protein TolC